VVDTSALYAILLDEAEAIDLRDALASADQSVMSAPSLFELKLVLWRRYGQHHVSAADRLVASAEIVILPFEAAHVELAIAALRRFGGKPSRLNYGDCMSYALAKSLDAPLLYKGDDFALTDIKSAL